MDVLVLVVLTAAVLISVPGWRLRAPGIHLVAAGLLGGLATVTLVLATRDQTVLAPDGPLIAGITLTGILAVAGGGVVTTSVFSLIDGSRTTDAGSIREAGEVLRGGAWIGSLERAAVFITLVADWPEGIAITLALKGLGRYPELRTESPGAAERFIIGTFTSVLWAIACAGAAQLMR